MRESLPMVFMAIFLLSLVIVGCHHEDTYVLEQHKADCDIRYFDRNISVGFVSGVYSPIMLFDNNISSYNCRSNAELGRIQIEKSGWYMLYFEFNTRANVDNFDLFTYIFLNGNPTQMRIIRTFHTNGDYVHGNVMSEKYLNVGDNLTIQAIQYSGGNRSATGVDGRFMVRQLR